MIELSALLWSFVLIFAIIGFLRGLPKELISLSGIILALFGLFQFDGVLRGVLLLNVPPAQQFFIQALIFVGITFFAYQTRGLGKKLNIQQNEGRDSLQSTVLGAIVGGINGYLICGSLWYFMLINDYPLEPFITRPLEGSASANAIAALPLYVLAGGPGGDGSVLSLAVIILFVMVLVLI